jgi:hypothetical protein
MAKSKFNKFKGYVKNQKPQPKAQPKEEPEEDQEEFQDEDDQVEDEPIKSQTKYV